MILPIFLAQRFQDPQLAQLQGREQGTVLYSQQRHAGFLQILERGCHALRSVSEMISEAMSGLNQEVLAKLY
jgi:hypothetical protein